jgi:putative photosynthetic complex assembly protein
MTDQSTHSGIYYDAENRTVSRPDKEKIPTRLVVLMFGLALMALVLTAISVLTGAEKVGVPPAEDPISTHEVTISGIGNAAKVVTTDGTVLLDAENGAFVTVVRSALDRARFNHRITENPPVIITRYPSGRMTLNDPATGWEMHLSSFGQGNKAHFERLLAPQANKGN